MRITSISFGVAVAIAILSGSFLFTSAQQSSGTVRGHVADEFGGSIVGATVTITDQSGIEKTVLTDSDGNFAFPAVAPGRYTVRVSTEGFAPFENVVDV